MKRYLTLFLMTLAVLVIVLAGVGISHIQAQPTTPDFETLLQRPHVSDHVLVKFVPGADSQLTRMPGARHLFDDWYVIPVSEGKSLATTMTALAQRDDVLIVEPDYLVQLDEPKPVRADLPDRAQAYPNDPYYQYQWHMPQVQSDAAWDINRGAGVIVAVVDTGVSRGSDLQCRTFVSPYDAITDTTGESAARDRNHHGTHVAGTIGQCTHNNTGVAGLAPDVKIMPVRVLDESGSGAMSQIGTGIRWAADHGADVINMSLGMDCYNAPYDSCHDAFVDDAIAHAVSKDIVIVAAAGNSGRSTPGYPANHPDVIAVAAVDYNRRLAPYSDHGSALSVSAPGGDLNQDANGDTYADGVLQETFDEYGEWGYYFLQGTSMASPHVAAAAALLRSYVPEANRVQVQRALEQTAMDLGAPGKDAMYGYGLIQVADALRYLKQHTTPTPTPYTWWGEAEDGALNQPIGVRTDENVSGCQYIYVTDDWSNGSASLNFTLPDAGNYYIWARAMGLSWHNNSFFVRIDDGEDFHFEIMPDENENWVWRWQEAPPPEEYEDAVYLSAGRHTIRFKSREGGSRLDAVLITNQANYSPSQFHPCQTTPPPPSNKRVWLPIALRVWPEPTPTPTRTPTRQPTPTPTATPGASAEIYGWVTYNNQKAPGIKLALRVYDNYSEDTVATTYTDSQGRYSFKHIATLPSGKRYYVRYGPNGDDDRFVYVWFGPDITSYRSGQTKHGGDFDIADVKLTSPPSGATRALPATFQWQKRSYTRDTYAFILFEPGGGTGWTTENLGYVGGVTITGLPSDVQYGKEYGWYPRPYNGGDSFGTPYYYRLIIFSRSANRTPLLGERAPMSELLTPELSKLQAMQASRLLSTK